MRELWNLGWVGALTAIGFLSVYTARQNEISSASLTYAGVFLGVFGLAHVGVRAGLPRADPWLLPLAALLCALGLTEIYRLSPTLARDQSVWVVVGLLAFLGMVFVVRDHRRLEAYGYLLATTAVGLLVVTMVVGTSVNGAKLWLRFEGVQVQPGEFAKLLLVVFLASFLREHREVLIVGARRVLGVTLPPLKHFGPMLVVWGASMFMLVFIRDLGSSLMFFAAFLALSPSISTMATAAPSAASAFAVAVPMAPAPVMNATCPVSGLTTAPFSLACSRLQYSSAKRSLSGSGS